MSSRESSALRLLGAYTAGRFDIYMLAGRAKASCRAHIMSELEGVKVPQSKAGVNALYHRFFEMSGVGGDCRAAREDALIAWCKAQSTDNVTLSASRDLARYTELRARGWVTLWAGEGRICLQAPAVETEDTREVIEEVR